MQFHDVLNNVQLALNPSVQWLSLKPKQSYKGRLASSSNQIIFTELFLRAVHTMQSCSLFKSRNITWKATYYNIIKAQNMLFWYWILQHFHWCKSGIFHEPVTVTALSMQSFPQLMCIVERQWWRKQITCLIISEQYLSVTGAEWMWHLNSSGMYITIQ